MKPQAERAKNPRRWQPARPRRDRPQSGPAAYGASLLSVTPLVADSEPDDIGLHEGQSYDDEISDVLPFDRVGAREIVENFPLPPDVIRVGRRRHEKPARGLVR